jgi:hypothetical protein
MKHGSGTSVRSGTSAHIMRYLQIAIGLFLGILAIFSAYLPVKHYSLFFSWIYSAPIVLLCLSALVFLVFLIRQYIKEVKPVALVPFIICLVSGFFAYYLEGRREGLDHSDTSFKASTDKFGDDGGFYIDFKKNGHVQAERHSHWELTSYWGGYRRDGDTIYLDIPLDFPLGKKAVLTDTTLRFLDDTVIFRAYKE